MVLFFEFQEFLSQLIVFYPQLVLIPRLYYSKVIEVNSVGKELLARIFSLVYIGDFVSFYLAILNKIDPTPVERVMYLKRELAKV